MSCTAFTSKSSSLSASGSGSVDSESFVIYLTKTGTQNFTTVNVAGNRMTNIQVNAISDVLLTGGALTAGSIQIQLVPHGEAQTSYVTNGSQTTLFTISPGQILNAASQVLVTVPSGSYDVYASIVVLPSAGGTVMANGSVNVLAVRSNI